MNTTVLRDSTAITAVLATTTLRCPHCGYQLRAAASARCAECGRDITLSVSSIPVLTRWWSIATTVCAVCLAALLAFVIPLYLDAIDARWQPFGPAVRDTYTALLLIPVGLAVMFMALLGARFFIRHRSRALQRVVAVAILLLTLSVSAWGFARASKLPFARAQVLRSQIFDFSAELPF